MSSNQNRNIVFSELGAYHRKERILDIAAELFAVKGYDAVTTLELSQAVGCSELSIFKIFPTKNHIYEEMFDEWKYMIRKQSKIEIINNSALDTLCKVYTDLMSHTFLRNPLIRPNLETAVYSRRTDGASQRILDELKEVPDFVDSYIRPIIEMGQGNGEIRNGDPMELAALFWNISAGSRFLERTFPSRYVRMPFSDFKFMFMM